MEERKWEDLNPDCLVNIFGRLGVESLVLDVPLVCKPWYKATQNPLCWQRLVFPHDIFNSRLADVFGVGRYYSTFRLIKFVVDRSHGSATWLVLPRQSTEEELTYASQECRALKFLAIPGDVLFDCGKNIPDLVTNWKGLEMLRLGSSLYLVRILGEISLHCDNFVALCVTRAFIGDEEASAIVCFLPKVKYLFLKNATLKKEDLVMILKGCKDLVKLDVRDCVGFDEDDDEILNLASHVKNFLCEGSKAEETDYDEFEGGRFCHDELIHGDYSD